MVLVKQNYGPENETVSEVIEGSIVVQGALVRINYPDSQNPSDVVLAFDFGTGKWKDENGKEWNEFEIRDEEI